ncbi:MAG TPA: aminotransferase class III-fold pyridoxal phosphate-dependent enzyme, partial [Myxococcota bacterium]|nr:aminotransferase class III-fold pyridoxal phosphate-dependent enzyme [Myxococcota bacterium]
ARAHSGRDEIAIVDGSHAWLVDDAPRAGGPAMGSDARSSRAVAKGRGAFDAWFHSIPRNDANAFEELLCRRRDRIGALLIEPIPLSPAQPALDADTLASLRSLCDRFEVALIVDESATGFRIARGGAQQAFDVRADLCTFGPSLANGYPIAALAGSEPIMRRFGKQVAQGIGSAAHPLSLAVADKTLQLLEETDALERIAKYGSRMREGLSQVLTRRGIPHSLTGPPAMIRLGVSGLPQPVDGNRSVGERAFASALAPRLQASGILCEPDLDAPWFVSAAHNELCLAETLAKFEHATDAVLELQSGAPGRSARAAARRASAFASPS